MPYMASLQNAARHHVCGGFLISEDTVLTAAHCDDDGDSMLTSVVLGTHDLMIDEKKMRYNIKAKCKHGEYNSATLVNDIMMLKLSGKVKLEKRRVETIAVPKTQVKMEERDICQVAGWGIARQWPWPVPQLQKVDVRFLNLDKCRQMWHKQLPDTVMCAGGFTVDGKGFCQGDSGGPLMCRGVPVGIVSFTGMGHDNIGNCSYPNVPNVYTNLSKYKDWIIETTKKWN